MIVLSLFVLLTAGLTFALWARVQRLEKDMRDLKAAYSLKPVGGKAVPLLRKVRGER